MASSRIGQRRDMSKSRKRNKRRKPRPHQSHRARRAELAAYSPHVELMFRADEAERRGDAMAALEIMESAPYDHTGKPFWRPWRAERLFQIVVLGTRLPGWATSRWVLAQAAQDLTMDRRRHGRAVEQAIEIRGGVENVARPPGEEPQLKVMDTDWVQRQLQLYEYGGLAHFVGSRAAPDLLAGADRIREWARTPMGGFRYLSRSPGTTAWEDLATGASVRIANIGSAALMVPGECAIGRLVPIEGGRMFETVPLRVSEATAVEVAADPPAWLDALRHQRDRGEPVASGSHRFDVVSDVPRLVSTMTVYDDLALDVSESERARRLVATAARVLGGDEPDDGEVDVWPCLARELLAPEVMAALGEVVGPADAEVFGALAERLVEPAAGICRELMAAARRAA